MIKLAGFPNLIAKQIRYQGLLSKVSSGFFGWSSISFLTLFLFATVGFWLGGAAVAQELSPEEMAAPKSAEATITAVVPEWRPPPVPVLIEPEDDAYVATQLVTFRWELPDHIVPYDSVDLFIDGEEYLSNLPLSSATTDDYQLTVDGNEYELILRSSVALDDGLYTWKIRANDFHQHSTDSTTWSFTVDSQAPPIIITDIDDTETAISSEDVTTVPNEPLVVETSKPVIQGKTETQAVVQLIIVWPDGQQTTLTTTADADGIFNFTLPTLTQQETITLQFTATDLAGHVTILDGLQLIYQPKKIEIPLPTIPEIPGLTPELFADPLVIDLPEFPPAISWPELKVPDVIAKPLAPIQKQIETFIKPITDLTTALSQAAREFPRTMALASLFFWWFYLVILYYLTGNYWRWFGNFVKQFLVWWWRGWPLQPHRFLTEADQRPLPALAFKCEGYDSLNRQTKSQLIFTDPDGRWNYLPASNLLFSLYSLNRRYLYPSQQITISEWRSANLNYQRNLYLTGESWFVDTDRTKQTSSDIFVLPPNLPVNWTAWTRPVDLVGWPWAVYLPRASLFLSFFLILLVTIWHFTWWSVLILIFISTFILRDWRWRLPHRWQVYTAKATQNKTDNS